MTALLRGITTRRFVWMARGSGLIVALAQQIPGEIGQCRARQRGEGQRAGDVDRGEADACGEQTVRSSFAHAERIESKI